MGQNQTIIQTKVINQKQLVRVQPVQVGLYFYPFRKYKQLSFPNDHCVILCLQNQIEQSIGLEYNRYQTLERALDQKTSQVVLNHVLFDHFNSNLWFYMAFNKQQKCSFIMRKFKEYESQLYKNIVYETHINQLVSDLKCNNLLSMTDTYSINTKLQEQYPYSQVFMFQEVQVNLSEIIRYRRENSCQWTTNEFEKLCWDLISALDVMHENNLTHNDIRPYNVYFSLNHNCFQLGNYKNVLKTDSEGTYRNVRLRVHPSFKVEDNIDGANNFTNHKKSDIYALGMTLLCAFYMTEPVQRKLVAPFNRAMQQKYPIMKILRKMIKISQTQLNTSMLKMDLQQCNKKTQLANIIESIRFRNKIRNKQVSMINRTFSSAYKRMGLWDKWRQSIYDAYEIQSGHLTEFQQASYFAQFSRIQKLLDNSQKQEQYALKAAKIYQKIGYNYFLQNNYVQSVNFFNKGLKCLQSCNISIQIILVKIYQGLSLVFAEKQQLAVSKSFLKKAEKILPSCNFTNKTQYYQIKFTQSKIYQYHLELQQSQKILKNLQQIMKDQSQKLIYEVQILKKLGKNSVAKAQLLSKSQRTVITNLTLSNQIDLINQQDQNIKKKLRNQHSIDNRKQKQLYAEAEWYYIEALNLAKSKNGNESYVQRIHIYKNLGKLKFNQQNPESAEYYFYQILRTIKTMNLENKQDQQNQNNYSIQKTAAETYCLIALCKQKQALYEQMLNNYNLSLSSYKNYYGEYHNRICAQIIGNMSLGYQKLNMHNRAIQCIDLSIQILYDVLGPNSIDYNHFTKVRQMLRQQQMKTSKHLQQKKNKKIAQLAQNLLSSIILKSNFGLSNKSIENTYQPAKQRKLIDTSIKQIQKQDEEDQRGNLFVSQNSQQSQSLKQLQLPLYVTQNFGTSKIVNQRALQKERFSQSDWKMQ